MRRYFDFVLAHRVFVVVTCLVITALSGWSMSRATMSTSLGRLLMGDHPAYERYLERVKQFGNDEQLIIAFEDPGYASPEGLARLRRIVSRITEMDDVARVESVLSAMRFMTVQGRPPSVTYEQLATNPIASGLVVSADGRHTAVIVELTLDEERSIERSPVIVREILDVFRAEGLDREHVHLGGILAVLAEVQVQTTRNVVVLTPIVAIVLLLVTWVLFRRVWPVFVTLLIGALAIAWTMGFAIALDRQVNIMLAICPALILIIAFSDVVHLCSAYLLALASGTPKDEAIRTTASEVGTACLFTSLTTMLGFLCLSIVKVPAFRQLGLVLGFGVAVALVLAMTLVPIMFSYMREPRPWTASLRSGSQHRVDILLAAARKLSTTRPWLVIASFAVIVGVCLYGTSRIDVECDIAKRFGPGNQLSRDTEYLDRHFAGTNVLDLLLEFKQGAPTLELMSSLESWHDELEALPGVGRVLSIVTVVRAAPPEHLVAALAETSAGHAHGVFSRLSIGQSMRFTMILHDTGMYGTYQKGQEAIRLAAATLGDDVVVEPSGFSYLAGLWLEQNVRSQRHAIMISFLVIAIAMAVLFRSFTVGVLSMVPNVVPLLALGGVLGYVWRVVDSDVAIVALIAIGIAVDDTIHFLCRYRVERRRADSAAMAIERTFSTAGRAIVMTSVIFAAGFAPFAFSDYLSFHLIGVLLPLVMISALLADLLLLPALITVGAIRLGR